MLSVKQGGIKYHFWVFVMTRPVIEPRYPGPLANILTIMHMFKEIIANQNSSYMENDETPSKLTRLDVKTPWQVQSGLGSEIKKVAF